MLLSYFYVQGTMVDNISHYAMWLQSLLFMNEREQQANFFFQIFRTDRLYYLWLSKLQKLVIAFVYSYFLPKEIRRVPICEVIQETWETTIMEIHGEYVVKLSSINYMTIQNS